MNGKQLWDRAKSLIPGGNQLLSKRPERFLPGLWPTYYSRCKGCEVWDTEGNHYFDFAQMGVGSCILGYADEDVNGKVKQAIDAGSMCSLNCLEELELAERLIALHPWADMARFARTGGEACSIAIRIARAFSNKSKIAFCGYHGWHDWYLAANIVSKSNLDTQLLTGLDPKGVPQELSGTALPFNYNKIEELERILAQHGSEIAAIMMEPIRNFESQNDFLHSVRALASKHGIPLIFDEITSGLRLTVGGAHLCMGVEPDMAIFGKALGNGYPISAIIGKKDLMDAAQDSFISSTYWTERVGYTAALAVLEKMERLAVPEHLIAYGKQLEHGWLKIAKKHDLKVHVSGIPPLVHLHFDSEKKAEMHTLYAEQMLQRGYLLGSAVYTTYAYSGALIEKFLEDTDAVFGYIKERELKGDLNPQHGVISAGFKRLN